MSNANQSISINCGFPPPSNATPRTKKKFSLDSSRIIHELEVEQCTNRLLSLQVASANSPVPVKPVRSVNVPNSANKAVSSTVFNDMSPPSPLPPSNITSPSSSFYSNTSFHTGSSPLPSPRSGGSDRKIILRSPKNRSGSFFVSKVSAPVATEYEENDNTEIVSFLSASLDANLDSTGIDGKVVEPISSVCSLKRPSVSFDSHDEFSSSYLFSGGNFSNNNSSIHGSNSANSSIRGDDSAGGHGYGYGTKKRRGSDESSDGSYALSPMSYSTADGSRRGSGADAMSYCTADGSRRGSGADGERATPIVCYQNMSPLSTHSGHSNTNSFSPVPSSSSQQVDSTPSFKWSSKDSSFSPIPHIRTPVNSSKHKTISSISHRKLSFDGSLKAPGETAGPGFLKFPLIIPAVSARGKANSGDSMDTTTL